MKKLLPLLLVLTSCALPRVKSPGPASESDMSPRAPQATPAAAHPWGAQPSGQPQLYARDGTPVSTQPTGTVAVSQDTGQTVSEPEGTRWTLLEQYQRAVNEREELEFEVRALGAALDQAETASATLTQKNDQLQSEITTYEERIAELEKQNLELASRLTTAQVRRLQAEKLLLEAKLDWKRVEVALNQNDSGAAPGAVPPAQPGPTAPGPAQKP
ncbi:MAG: hypothetical protein H6828_03550 [Planctomycetes bacterium]|nr:hypothetical protein [Planctomycetota bacterium]